MSEFDLEAQVDTNAGEMEPHLTSVSICTIGCATLPITGTPTNSFVCLSPLCPPTLTCSVSK